MRNFIYTCNGASATNAADDAVMFPADKVLRMEPTSATTTTVFFMSHVGDLKTKKLWPRALRCLICRTNRVL